MQVYRHKTRSTEVISSAEVTHGKTGWVDGKEYVFDGPTKKWLSVEDFRSLRKTRAAEKARRSGFFHRRDRSSTFTH